MKLYFHKTKGQIVEYNIRLIEHILCDYFVPTPEEADIVIVSLCDITELPELIKAKKYGKPVLTGGMISEYPIINELSDYVWHGEIYGFRDCLRAGMELKDMPSITTREENALVIDQKIQWEENPIIKVGGRAMYYYIAKGCPVKCKYCYIGNVREYQAIPEALYNRALRTAGKNLMPIAAYNPYGLRVRTNIGETLLKRYIKGEMKEGARTLRSGVEFVTPALSKSLAKGVTIDDVNEAIDRSRAEKTKLILYYIAGLESQEELGDHFNRIHKDFSMKHPLTFVFTYIDPQPFTPFHDFDLRGKVTGIDVKKLYWIASQRNKRVRMMPLAGPEKSDIRTLLSRATSRDDYKLIAGIKKTKHNEILGACESRPWLLGKATIEEICARPRKQIVPEYWRPS
jgi:hypothetical protein